MDGNDRFWEQTQRWDELAAACRTLLLDFDLPTVRAWKACRADAKAVGCFPVYTPQEIITAAGALPVSLFGARGQVEIDHADSRIQSFVCSIARSTLELGLTRRLECLDAFVVPSICDVARNLSGVWQHNFSEHAVFYLHLPQNVDSEAAGVYYRGELERLGRMLGELTGRPVTCEALRAAIRVYNHSRTLLAELLRERAAQPERWPLADLYAVAAAGNVLPREDHNQVLERALVLGKRNGAPKRDLVRVALRGAFCEQPPLELLTVLEEAGCAVVDDDLAVGARFFLRPIPEEGDPLTALATAYRQHTMLTPVNNPGHRSRNQALVERCQGLNVQGVIFASPKFCEPALYDAVRLRRAAEHAGLPTLEFEYEEKMTVFESVRVQAETFVESILFFS